MAGGDGAGDAVMVETVGRVLGTLRRWRRWEWCWGRCDGGDGAGDAETMETVGMVLAEVVVTVLPAVHMEGQGKC